MMVLKRNRHTCMKILAVLAGCMLGLISLQGSQRNLVLETRDANRENVHPKLVVPPAGLNEVIDSNVFRINKDIKTKHDDEKEEDENDEETNDTPKKHLLEKDEFVHDDKHIPEEPVVENEGKKVESNGPNSSYEQLVAAGKRGEIVNPHPFKFLISPTKLCKDPELFVVAYVHSAAKKIKRRAIVRETWGNAKHHGKSKVKVIFFMGLVSPKEQKIIDRESKQYGDIVQESYLDSYKNLSYKGVGALKWIDKHCRQAKFILKSDDDAFVNIFTILKHLRDLNATGQTRDLFMCRRVGGMPVLRKGKWNVSMTEYPNSKYPIYCSGLAFILTTDLASRLYEASLRSPFLWVDDAYITGVVVKTANITHTPMLQAYCFNKTLIQTRVAGPEWSKLAFGHLGPKAILPTWKSLLQKVSHNKIPPIKGKATPGKF